MSMMVSFVLSFFPRDVLDEILNLIESVSEDFPSYSLKLWSGNKNCQHTKGNNSISRKTTVTVHVLCTYSYGV